MRYNQINIREVEGPYDIDWDDEDDVDVNDDTQPPVSTITNDQLNKDIAAVAANPNTTPKVVDNPNTKYAPSLPTQQDNFDDKKYTNVYGWKVRNDVDGNVDRVKHHLEQLSTATGITPRALVMSHMPGNDEINVIDRSDPRSRLHKYHSKKTPKAGVRMKWTTFSDEDSEDNQRPSSGVIGVANDIPEQEKEYAFYHEFFHHLQHKMGGVDTEGGQSIRSHQQNPISFTGFGYDPDDRGNQFLSMAHRSKNSNGDVDRQKWRDNIYNNIVDNKAMKQRPEMKKAWATAFSHMVTDHKLLAWSATRFKNNDNKDTKETRYYKFDPEELGARALAKYVSLANMSEEDREWDFENNESHITKETYGHIKNWFRELKVINGNTLAKNKTTNNGTSMV
jgi:hypothetical protein